MVQSGHYSPVLHHCILWGILIQWLWPESTCGLNSAATVTSDKTAWVKNPFASTVVGERWGVSFLTLLWLSYTTQNTPGSVWAVNIVNVDAYRLQVTTKWKLVSSVFWAEIPNSGFDVVINTLQKWRKFEVSGISKYKYSRLSMLLDLSWFFDAEQGGVQRVCLALISQWLQEHVVSWNHRCSSGYVFYGDLKDKFGKAIYSITF